MLEEELLKYRMLVEDLLKYMMLEEELLKCRILIIDYWQSIEATTFILVKDYLLGIAINCTNFE